MKRCSPWLRRPTDIITTCRKRSIVAERLLRYRPTFSKSLMVSVSVSKLSCTELFFVEPGIKVDSRYYRQLLLKQQMLLVMHWIAGSTYVLQQDSTPAHWACDTVQLLQQDTSQFIAPGLWPPNSPDLNAVDYNIWVWCRSEFIKLQPSHSWPQAAHHWDVLEHSADGHWQSHCRVTGCVVCDVQCMLCYDFLVPSSSFRIWLAACWMQ